MSRLVALYPRPWRDRYEDEFLALLAERPPDPVERLDIVRGAIDARLHPQVKGSRAVPETPVARGPWPVRAGWLTLTGGVLWIVTMIVAVNAPIVVDGGRPYRDAAAAAPLFFVAVALLGVGMLAVVLELPMSARAARTAAFVSSIFGLLWALAPWLVPVGMVAFAGLLVVALAAWRARRWSSLELGILLAGVGLGWGPILAYSVGLWVPHTPDPDTQFLVFGVMVAAWVAVGASLVRAPRRRVALDPPVA